MLYNLLLPYSHHYHIANLFTYISFRSGLAIIFSFGLSLIIGPIIIKNLKKMQKKGQPIRSDGPQTHLTKAGTPTMGGVLIIASSIITTLLFIDITNKFVWVSILIYVVYAILGFMDDYKKVKKDNHYGVSGKSKVFIQIITVIAAYYLLTNYTDYGNDTRLSIPFLKSYFIDLGILYLPFIIIVVIGSSNAVNLTDGLDGLAAGTIIIAVASFGLICYLIGNNIYANYLQIIYIPNTGELAILCCSIIGSCLGFLWFNSQPAEIFMGDTGSLSLGGVLGMLSVITKHELVLSIIGGIFVVEAISVILQVGYFKKTKGKRIFLMAPIHHHFEKKGLPESKLVIRFWIMAFIFALIGLSSLKLR